MRAMLAALLALLAALSGCLGQVPVDQGDERGERDGERNGERDGEREEPAHTGLQPTTWYLHADPQCPECTCGSPVFSMDLELRDSGCRSRGNTGSSRVADVAPVACADICFPANGPMPPYPAGTSVEAVVHVTNHAADVLQVTAELRNGDRVVGAGSSGEALVAGLGGLDYTAFRVTFTTTEAIDPALGTELALRVAHHNSFFVGLAEPNLSQATIG